MSFTKNDVVTAYREALDALSNASAASTIQVLAYFLIRMQMACQSLGLDSKTDVRQFQVLSEQSLNPESSNCERLSQQYSQVAQSSDSADDGSLLVVGFWSILSYWASFLIGSETRFSRYSLDVFLAGLEDALLEEPEKLAIELENFYDALVQSGSSSEHLVAEEFAKIQKWVESKPIGERLGVFV